MRWASRWSKKRKRTAAPHCGFRIWDCGAYRVRSAACAGRPSPDRRGRAARYGRRWCRASDTLPLMARHRVPAGGHDGRLFAQRRRVRRSAPPAGEARGAGGLPGPGDSSRSFLRGGGAARSAARVAVRRRQSRVDGWQRRHSGRRQPRDAQLSRPAEEGGHQGLGSQAAAGLRPVRDGDSSDRDGPGRGPLPLVEPGPLGHDPGHLALLPRLDRS